MSKLEETFNKGHTYRQWIFSLLANCTLLAYGMECGWISPTTKILQSAESPTGKFVSDSTLSWIASSMSLSAIFGVSIYTFVTDTYGRKLGVILIAIPQTVSLRIYCASSSKYSEILEYPLAHKRSLFIRTLFFEFWGRRSFRKRIVYKDRDLIINNK